MKTPRILNLKKAVAPKNGVTIYAVVQSISRPNRVNHNVTKQGRSWMCSCERFIIRREICSHIRRVKARLARKAA